MHVADSSVQQPGAGWKAPEMRDPEESDMANGRWGWHAFVVVEADGDDQVHSMGRLRKASNYRSNMVTKPSAGSWLRRPYVPFARRKYYGPFCSLSMTLPENACDWDDIPKAEQLQTSVNMKMDIREERPWAAIRVRS